jgi:hypothetical protein
MSNDRMRDRGNLFPSADKKKPSQPELFGDCVIDKVAYEIRGWHREEQLALSIAPPRGDRNTYPPDVFRGSLEAVVTKPAKRGAPVEVAPAWSGEIESDDAAYKVQAFEKQGKSGQYFTLSFERTEKKGPIVAAVRASEEPEDSI